MKSSSLFHIPYCNVVVVAVYDDTPKPISDDRGRMFRSDWASHGQVYHAVGMRQVGGQSTEMTLDSNMSLLMVS